MCYASHNTGFDLGEIERLENVIKRAQTQSVLSDLSIRETRKQNDGGTGRPAVDFRQELHSADCGNKYIEKHDIDVIVPLDILERLRTGFRRNYFISVTGKIEVEHFTCVRMIFNNEQLYPFVKRKRDLLCVLGFHSGHRFPLCRASFNKPL
jgi:hypothetical protein